MHFAHAPSTMRSRPGRASAHPPNPRAMAAGPPRCRCDKHVLAQLKTTDMRDRRAAREGISWSQYRGSAFFHFCHERHNTHWPADIRGARGNRHTRPRDADPMAGAAAEAPRISVPPAFCLSSRHQCKASTGGLLRPRRVGQCPLAQQSLTVVDGLGCTAPRPGSKAEKAALAVPIHGKSNTCVFAVFCQRNTRGILEEY